MQKPHIDFNAVSYAHEGIHKRLLEWARYVQPRRPHWVHPMWRWTESSKLWAPPEPSIPIDTEKASAVEKAVGLLPANHAFALRWCYVYGGQPRKAAQHVGESLEGLQLLIVGGRQMLINRRV